MTKSKKHASSKSILLTLIGFVLFSVLIAVLLRGKDVILFNPKGFIADEQLNLLVLSTVIMLAFGVPILFFLYYFAWKYRETNDKAKYNSSSDRGKFATFAIWASPTVVAIILAAFMLPATQKLEPQDKIASDKETLRIQVVALRWKWLFIYPEQQVASVNFVQIPEDTPVQFELTADETPMSSFWIPHLGGMLYAMTEHVNRLNLIAETPGDYEGSAAEINGSGFAGMRFNTRVSTEEAFDLWVRETQSYAAELTTAEYATLLKPSKDRPAVYYSNPDPDLYSSILQKYASGSHGHDTGQAEHGGSH